MKMARLIAVIGFLVFAASFFLPAVKERGEIPGYECALITIVMPWTSDAGRPKPLDYFAVLLSGWINPVFLITFVLLLVNPMNRVAGILRIVLIFMFAACWIVFYRGDLRPRAGYFIWTGAMLLTLFAGKLFPGRRTPKAVHIG